MTQRRTRRAIVLLTVTLIVVLAVLVGGAGLALRGAPRPAASPSIAPVATTTVTRTDLTQSESFDGTLAYGAVTALKGTGDGILTALPAVGDIVDRGSVIYRVNDRPVPVFLGDTPLFRSLDLGAVTAAPVDPGADPTIPPVAPPPPPAPIIGADVAMVAANLAALGYPAAGVSSDPHEARWSRALSRALGRWQKSVGLEATGTLAPGAIVVLPGKARVSSVAAQVGDAVAGEVLSLTGTSKAVSAPVKSTDVALFAVGTAVSIGLPDGRSVPGTVSAISTMVVTTSNEEGTVDVPTMDVTIAPVDPAAVDGLDYAAVKVTVVVGSHPGVLAAPVEVLLALKGGGYAVQLPSGDLVPVTTGMFAQDLVELSGDGITEGLTVVTAS
ncbi:hypothetical protein [Pengzhenrongella sicca]|uniref:Peptidoglycan-binding protein n=1 Tax=Pengzhenrongella sicca TaxID=2819238 RepID=A0A8A4ZG71_9MICO|nr:hypothetical protein [Pengzhenrongella sicca]QTE31030.1 hypothetical protein J4E96_08970 [Pengzhenrongella sicca]